VPLFVEELTKTLIEGGGCRADGHYVLDRPLPSLATDDCTIVAARPRPAGAGEEVAEIGAVVGREFSTSY
jgi:hypothetical protein